MIRIFLNKSLIGLNVDKLAKKIAAFVEAPLGKKNVSKLLKTFQDDPETLLVFFEIVIGNMISSCFFYY